MLRALAGKGPVGERARRQVDERVAPAGHPDRNLTHLRESLLEHAPLRPDHIYAMPVELPDLEAAARGWLDLRRRWLAAGPRPGSSRPGPRRPQVPGDAVLEITDADVAVTGAYQERRRMTLTYPMLNRSRRVLWLVTGSEKAGMLVRLRDGDRAIPAGRVHRDRALVLADHAAAEQLGTNE